MSDIKLDQSLAPSFTRASTAFTPDGTSVASGTPRYVNVVNDIIVDTPSEWDRGTYSRMSGLSYNLLTVNQSSFETDTTGTSIAGTATRSVSTDWAWVGTQSLKCMTASSSSNRIDITVNLQKGLNHIGSAYAYNPSSGIITISCNIAGNTSSVFSIPASGVVRIYATYTSDVTSVSTFRFWEATGQTFYIDGTMLEAVAGATTPSPWIIGGSYGVGIKAMPVFTRTNSAYTIGVDQGTKTPRYSGDIIELAAVNGYEYSEPTAGAQMSANSNVTFTSDFGAAGFTNCITFGDNSIQRWGYPKSTSFVVSGKTYTLSVYIKKDDLTIPTVGITAGKDLSIALGNSQVNTATYVPTVTSIGGGVYRVSVTAPAYSTSNNNGLVKNTSGTSVGFKATGFQIEENPSATSYIRTTGATVFRAGSYNTNSILLEGSATNLLQKSEQFDDAYWTKTGTSVTADATTAPKGLTAADKIVEDSASSFHLVARYVSVTAGSYYSNSVYAKAGERGWFRINVGTAGGGAYCNFNLTTGTIGNSANCVNKQIVAVGNGWYRCTMSALAVSTASTTTQFAIMDSDSTNTSAAGVTYTGDGTSGLYIWGAQNEVTARSTTYIPTTTASVTRNTETLSIVNNGILNTSAGAAVVKVYVDEFLAGASPGAAGNNLILDLNSGVANDRLYLNCIANSATPWRLAFVDSAGVTTTPTTLALAVGWHTVATRWSGSTYEFWVDGSYISSGSYTPVTAWSKINIGGSYTGVSNCNTLIDFVHLYATTPSTGEMAMFTTTTPTGAVYSLDFGSNLDYAASGIYTSEWFNGGVSGMVWTASGSVTTPTGTNALREYRTANSDTQADASAWSTTLGTGKYVQFRENLIATSAASTRPVVNSTTLMTPSLGKAIIIERAGTNLLTAPTVPAAQAITVTPGSTYALSFAGNAISSGAVQIQHEKIETSTADFGTGTLSNVSASSNALTLATAKADPTLTRATVAYLPDELTQVASGVARYASGAIYGGATNLITYSSDFSNTSYWSVLRVTISSNSNATAAPDGTWTADKLIEDTQTGAHYINRTSLFTIGTTNTISVYAKAGERSYLGISWAANVTVSGACFNLSNGTVATTAGVTASIQSVGNGWYRCMMTGVAGATTASFNICTDSAGTYSYTGDGTSGIYIWGAQAELTSDGASTYLPTNGAVNTRPTNMSVDRAIMIEEATTNKCTYSQDLSDASWAKTRSSITADAVVAPDGTTTADKIVEDSSASTTHLVAKSAVISGGADASYSVYAKAAERSWIQVYTGSGSEYAYFDVGTGAVGTVGASASNAAIKSIGNGWYRCSFKVAAAVGTGVQIRLASGDAGSSYTGDGTSGLYIWGVQVEDKAYTTTYVATTSATVTRNAEAVQFTNTNVLSNPSVGSFIGRFKITQSNFETGSITKMLADLGGTGASGMWIGINTGPVFRFNYGSITGSSTSINSSVNPVVDVWYTLGVTWGASGAKMYLNGTQVASGAVGANVVPLTSIYYVGSNGGTIRFINSLISDWVIYREELSDTEMHLYTSTGSVIPGDYRTAYDLRFEDNLLHGEGGSRITPAQSLTDIGTIVPTGTTVAWSETETATTSENMVWINPVNVTVTGNTVQKTAGVDGTYDTSAESRQWFQKGQNFYVQFVPGNINSGKYKFLGIMSAASAHTSYTDMDYSIGILGTAAYPYEDGVQKTALNSSGGAAGDVYRIDCIDDVVSYYRNGVLAYTSTRVPEWPMYAAVSIRHSNEYVSGAVYGFYPKVDIDTSIDGGSTFYSMAQSGSITGLTSDISSSGLSFLTRQKLYTPRSATLPSLNDITYQFAQKQTKNKHELIVPIYSSLRFTPSSTVTKWQTELRNYSSNMQLDGTARVGEVFSISNASGIINPGSGTVIIKFYVDEVFNAATNNREGVLFDCAVAAASGRIAAYLNDSTPSALTMLFYSTYGTNSNLSKSKALSIGWHTMGFRWDSSSVSMWLDGAKESEDLSVTLPTAVGTTIRIGESFTGSSELDTPIAQFNAFREAITDAEMIAYTAASTATIPLTLKHTLQMNFEDNLKFGMTGVFRSRWLDAGSNCTDTPWVTYTEVVTKPTGTDIQYRFKASNTQSEAVTYDTDIASQTGRYIKLEAILMSDDAGTTTPTLTGIKTYPEYS